MIYGYERISTMKQSIQRQIDNIKKQYPTAIIIDEAFTGTTTDRPKWNGLDNRLEAGDTVIFDEVSRMSRNAEEGFRLYETLFNRGVNLIFLKEPYLNTDTYKTALEKHIDIKADTGSGAIDEYISDQSKAINKLLMGLAKEQIALAFKTAQAEVDYLHQRTSEGVRKAQANGKVVGRPKGADIETKKAKECKEILKKHCRDFGGTLSDAEVMKLTGLARNTYYKYKREIKA